MNRPDLASLGRSLRECGLRQDLVQAATGASNSFRASAANCDWRQLATTGPGALIAAFVGGRSVPRAVLREALAGTYPRLIAAELLVESAADVSATCAVLPHGEVFACSPIEGDLPSAIPDDSSLHLCGVIGRAHGSWLDIGTGSALAPLVCGGARVTATDVDEELLRCAAIGIALSGRSGIELAESDLFESLERRRYDLVTFNAPIEGADALLDRFWAAAGHWVETGGKVVVHSVAGAGHRATAELDGLLISARYTPDNFSPAFAISAFYPGRPRRRIDRITPLTASSPHARPDWISLDDIG